MLGWPVFINFAAMKAFTVVMVAVVCLCSCGRETAVRPVFTVETMNRITPVKQQGGRQLGWVYAMLAVIESDRLMQGDSVNLSPAYVVRRILEHRAERCYLSGGAENVDAAGMAPGLLAALEEFGAMPYDSYRSDCNYDVLCRKLTRMSQAAVARREGIERLRGNVADALDRDINPLPRRVWMYGAEYTTREFAHSVCLPGDYVAMTSYTHEPFGEGVSFGLPADRTGSKYINVPLDTLVSRVAAALRSGRSVCWEGDTTGVGFSFGDGLARLESGGTKVTQDMRQRAFERLEVTPRHCMAIIGLARDGDGRRWFVCKNSWGGANPYNGLMYMSEQYFRLNTVDVVMMNKK